MNKIPLDQLQVWDKNPKNLSKTGYERLKKQIKLGQHSTLLIMPDGTVIGGNSRLKIMKELKIPSAKVIVLSFTPALGGYAAMLDGEVQKDPETGDLITFATIEDGMMAYALSHNDTAGTYSDQLIDELPNYNLDWDMFGASTKETQSIADWADAVAPGSLDDEFPDDDELPSETITIDSADAAPKKDKESDIDKFENRLTECPDCGAVFDPKKHKARKGAVEGDISADLNAP